MLYRTVQTSFWTDRKVEEDFTPEDRYFYLYLFTNPHTNLIGCSELGIKQASYETGYNKETMERLIQRFTEVHKVIRYYPETREVLILNWHKYNWTKSGKFLKAVKKQIESVKSEDAIRYIYGMYTVYNQEVYGMDTVSNQETYPMHTSNANTNTDSNTNTNRDINNPWSLINDTN